LRLQTVVDGRGDFARHAAARHALDDVAQTTLGVYPDRLARRTRQLGGDIDRALEVAGLVYQAKLLGAASGEDFARGQGLRLLHRHLAAFGDRFEELLVKVIDQI